MDIESVTNCDSEDCYKLEITYDHDLELIDLIKENSFECQQTMKVVAYFWSTETWIFMSFLSSLTVS